MIHEEANGIAVDGNGNTYVTGRSAGTATLGATFGDGEPNQTTLVGDVIFVASYDPNGALAWARRAGGTGFAFGRGIAVDQAGNSYVTGYFYFPATFGPGEPNQITLTSAGESDIFIAKYGADGALAWARRAGGPSLTQLDEGYGIAADAFGGTHIVGRFGGTATFGAGEVNQTVLTSAGGADVFIARYSGGGDLLWAMSAGGGTFDASVGVAVDGAGGTHITGAFDGTSIFGAGQVNQTTLVSAGGTDVFIARHGGGPTNQAPQLTIGTDPLLLEGDAAGGYDNSGGLLALAAGVSATDPDGDDVTLTNDAPAFLPLGDTSVIWTAADPSDATDEKSQTVRVQDTTGPTVDYPNDIEEEVTSPAGAPVGYAVSASDAVDPEPTVICAPESGSMFLPGTTTVSCSASDAGGNETIVSFNVTLTLVTPADALQGILDLFDASVAGGALVGSGAGNSAAGRLGALRNMLVAAGRLIQAGDIEDSCGQLRQAYLRIDGLSPPPDFAAGAAAVDVAAEIQTLMGTLGCP